jgi:hypothetical protein
MRREGLEHLLGGPFEAHHISIDTMMKNIFTSIIWFGRSISGANASQPSSECRSHLTFALQAVGWSGKNMATQLKNARHWHALHQRRQHQRKHPDYMYDGSYLDVDLQTRQLIFDFIQNAKLQYFPRSKHTMNQPMLALRSRHGNRQMKAPYKTQVDGARHYIGLYGARSWQYIQEKK